MIIDISEDGYTIEWTSMVTGERKSASIVQLIDALEAVGEIKEIINISNFAIQEDVLKYKMICEVVEKMGGGENDSK